MPAGRVTVVSSSGSSGEKRTECPGCRSRCGGAPDRRRLRRAGWLVRCIRCYGKQAAVQATHQRRRGRSRQAAWRASPNSKPTSPRKKPSTTELRRKSGIPRPARKARGRRARWPGATGISNHACGSSRASWPISNPRAGLCRPAEDQNDEATRLRWRNRYLEGRVKYLEEELVRTGGLTPPVTSEAPQADPASVRQAAGGRQARTVRRAARWPGRRSQADFRHRAQAGAEAQQHRHLAL